VTTPPVIVDDPAVLVQQNDFVGICSIESVQVIYSLGTCKDEEGYSTYGVLVEYNLKPLEVIKGSDSSRLIYYWYCAIVHLVGGGNTFISGNEKLSCFIWGKQMRSYEDIPKAALSAARLDNIDWKLAFGHGAIDSSHYATQFARSLAQSDSLRELWKLRSKEGVVLYKSTFGGMNDFINGMVQIESQGEYSNRPITFQQYLDLVRKAAAKK
jgi:hypothetical protein